MPESKSPFMALQKGSDESKIILAMLHDIHLSHGDVFNYRSLRNTRKKVLNRLQSEGIGFLTKTLPALGKALDRALTLDEPLNCTELRFKPMPGTKLPMFMGEFFQRILDQDGTCLPSPCVSSVRIIRQICTLFYKYKLPYEAEQELAVVNAFKEAEDDLKNVSTRLQNVCSEIGTDVSRSGSRDLDGYVRACNRYFGYELSARRFNTGLCGCKGYPLPDYQDEIVDKDRRFHDIARRARFLLWNVLGGIDPKCIIPRHGPGAVADKQSPPGKYEWTNVSDKLVSEYPFDAYFCASLGHVCDSHRTFSSVTGDDHAARVILVPKDSRGPRLISAEPVENQWIQQGLREVLVSAIESHYMSKGHVLFTNQDINRQAALKGSIDGSLATLDLKEASDRVGLDLVRLLFPQPLLGAMEACRSPATVLPNGEVMTLNKFAPMGSSLCFPVMACTIWAILSAGAPDWDTYQRIHVYGDDVIVPTAYAVNAMKYLEWFGLKINRRKSCCQGLFRESCGLDALAGQDVTPVKIKTVWTSTPSPEAYVSFIAIANELHARQYYTCYNTIVEELLSLYGPIPEKSMNLFCPSLVVVPESHKRYRSRINYHLQKKEWRVRDVAPQQIRHVLPGWLMLLRFFAEKHDLHDVQGTERLPRSTIEWPCDKFSASSYTHRHTGKLVWRWR